MGFCDVMSCPWIVFLLLVLYKILDRLVRLPRVGHYGDRYVLVTGCGQGFGHALVKRLDRLGCHVFAGCRKLSSVQELREHFSDRVHPFLIDVSDRKSVRNAFEYVTSQLPKNTGLWGVVNNAGIGHVTPFELLDVSVYDKMLRTNLYGTIDVTMTFLPLIKRARGRIVNMSSLSGRFTLPVVTAYSMSKCAVEAFTDGLRRSIRQFGCKALLIAPGVVKTNILNVDMILSEFEDLWKNMNKKNQLTKHEETLLATEREKLRSVVVDYPAKGSIDDVTDAYEHALFGVVPRARYVIGLDTKFYILLQWLPEWFSDWVINRTIPTFQCQIEKL